MLDSGQKDKALPILQRALGAQPDSVRVKDALAAVTYDPEFWTDEVDRLADEAERLRRRDMRAHAACAPRASCASKRPDDPRLEELLKRIFVKDIDEPRANFMYETLLAERQRAGTISRSTSMRRAERAADTAARSRRCACSRSSGCSASRTRIAARSSSTRALKATAPNGASPMRSIVAAFTLLRQVHGDKGEWTQLLDLADAVLERIAERRGQAVRRDPGRPHRVRQGQRHRRARRSTSRSPRRSSRRTRTSRTSCKRGRLDDVPIAAGSMPAMPAAKRRRADADEAEQAASPTSRQEVARRAQGREGRGDKLPPKPRPRGRSRLREGRAPNKRRRPLPLPKPRRPLPTQRPLPQGAADSRGKAAARRRRRRPRPSRVPGRSRRRDGARRRTPRAAPTRASLAWKDVVAKFPTEQRAAARARARAARARSRGRSSPTRSRTKRPRPRDAGADKAEVFLELAETYGKLNNDNQVIASLTQAIAARPVDARRVRQARRALREQEALARSRQGARREGRAHARRQRRRSRSISRSRTSTSSGSRTRPRRSRRSRRSSSSIRTTRRPIDHLLAVYEKRRDWEKLIKLKEAEIERTPESERAAKVIEVARMAATKVKKPEICTYWWEKVVQYEPTHEEALTELYKLYERNKEWDKLADICQRQADAAPDAKVRADALQRLGLLYTEKVENSAKAIDAWQKLLAIDENNRRAQDALKKLYVTEGRWDDLEEFYRSRGKIDEYIRVLEREVEAGSEPHRLALAMKIAVLYRDELQKADRAMRAFEKVLSLDENNLAAAEALIPLYEAGRDPQGARPRARDPARARRRTTTRSRARSA